MGILKKIGKGVERIFKTGRSAANRSAREATILAAEAEAARKALELKTKREKARANKLAVRGLRSKRSASYFGSGANADNAGSTTIG